MLSGNLFQFEEYHSQNHQPDPQLTMAMDARAVGDIHDYLTCDLKLSDTALNDLLSDFDINTQELQSYEPQLNHITYSHLPIENGLINTVELPPAYDTVLVSNNNNNMPSNIHHMGNLGPTFDSYIRSDGLNNSVMEQHQVQESMIKYSPSTPSPPLSMHSTNYSETSSLLSMEMQEYTTPKTASTRKQTPSKRSRASGQMHQLPKLVKKPEPIPVTIDQFQALMRSTPDTSTQHVGQLSSFLDNGSFIANSVPLKIISHPNQILSHSSDENSRHDSPMNSNSITTTNSNLSSIVSHTTGRLRRKSSHNAIEKRYRSSINERILELKEIVAANDEKVQKSGVLRRTIEYIHRLQSTNRRLEEENNTLKAILKRLNLTNSDFPTDQGPSSIDSTPSRKHFTTPPSSQSDSGDSTLGSSDEAPSPIRKKQKRTTGKQGMVNGSRLILCCFMLCVLITNPFSYLLNRIHGSDIDDSTELRSIVSSRTLQSASSSNDDVSSSTFLSASWRQLVAWMLNMAICLVCLVKLFVYGEPIVSDVEMQEYDVYKKKADQMMAENLLNEARDYYRQCCEKLYVSIDHSWLYYFSSITWQMTRFCVNLIFLGRWLTFWSGWTKSIDTRDYNRELNDCLLQLWKIEYEYSSSSLSLFNLFISTINTSMNAGKKLDLKKRNEIYFLSALTLKRFGGIFYMLVPYTLKRLQLTDLNDMWLADLDRLKEFIFDKENFRFKRGKVLDSIRDDYLDYILYEDIRNQLINHEDSTSNVSIKLPSDLNAMSWWQHAIQVIRCISDDRQNLDALSSTDLIRQNATLTVYQMARTMNLADERLIKTIEAIHRILLMLNDDEEAMSNKYDLLMNYLGKSSRLMIAMIEENSNHDKDLHLAIKTLMIDGILSLRLRLLTNVMSSNDGKSIDLQEFQQELDHYRSLNRLMKLPKQRVHLFESILRISSGLNPLSIQTLFEGAVKQQTNQLQTKQESPSMDIIAAVLLFCHFSPSTVFHYRTFLQQAANLASTSRKNYDLQRLRQQCLTVIRQPYLTL